MKFEKGKRYIVERTSKAHGGGLLEVGVQNMTEKYIKYNDVWHTIKSTEERFTILEEITEEDS